MPELRAELARRGLPQWRLAADLGFSPSTLNAIVKGRRPAPINLVSRIAALLGLDEKVLVTT